MARSIESELFDFIDGKLKNDGIAQHAIQTKDARLLMTQAARTLVGIREKTGNNDGHLVELLQETIGDAEHESYCMSTVQSCIAYAETKLGVHSPVFGSEHCLTVWQGTPVEQRVKISPLPGAICIWRHGHTSSGHTGIVLAADEEIMHLVEGNTNAGSNDPNGKVERNGGGCYFTKRSRHGTGDMSVVGFIKPF